MGSEGEGGNKSRRPDGKVVEEAVRLPGPLFQVAISPLPSRRLEVYPQKRIEELYLRNDQCRFQSEHRGTERYLIDVINVESSQTLSPTGFQVYPL